MPVEQLHGTETHWRSWGNTADRRALMIHCSLAHSGAWTGVAERLSDALYLQAFDIPGHGKSGEWEGAQDIVDQTVSMALGLIGDTPVDLIGHSFGAVVCLRIAVEHPQLVRSLSLFEPVFFAAAKAQGYDTDAPFAEFGAAIEANRPDEAARHFMALWGAGERWEDIPERQREFLAARIHLIVAGEPALHKDNANMLTPGRLEAADMPVLLMEGSASPPVIPAINAALAKRLPNAQRATFAGAGHMGPITHAALVAKEIRAHLKL